MVWPKAIGSAVFSQARSAKVGDTKRSRSTAAMAPSTFSSAMPDAAQLGDQALHGRDVHGRPASVGLDGAASNCAASLRRIASWVRSRCSGVTEM